MSIIQVNNLSYIHSDRTPLFEGVSFSVSAREKVAVVGDNGSGKTTLLRVLAGAAVPAGGSLAVCGNLWYVPQHFGQYGGVTVARALGIGEKVAALESILAGDMSLRNYDILGDDWDIAERAFTALEKWGLGGMELSRRLDTLSGGEKTRVFLGGIDIHRPDVILMDEPTNHLDRQARERLYEMIRTSLAAMVIVSHDRTLLNLPERILELGSRGITAYGGNYDFYKEQKAGLIRALKERVADREKSLRRADQTAREALERKSRQDARGKGKVAGDGIPRIMRKKFSDTAASSARRIKDAHAQKIGELTGEIAALKGELPDERLLKIKLGEGCLHKGKLLVSARDIDFSYGGRQLWGGGLSFEIRSGERIVIEGGNGSGKTTLIKLITGSLEPSRGTLTRGDGLKYLYIDQEYSLLDDGLAVMEQLRAFNVRNLPEHLLGTELHRFLFPAATWDKPCGRLSGGEKMRLTLCCMTVSDDMPDLFILDEPTNNLDIRSLEIVTATLKGYGGTLLVVSHDDYFTREVGANRVLTLP